MKAYVDATPMQSSKADWPNALHGCEVIWPPTGCTILINKATSVIHFTVVNLFRDKPLLLWRRLHLNDSTLTRPIKKYAINVAPPPMRTIHRLLFPRRGL
jgi:hypothetical protein